MAAAHKVLSGSDLSAYFVAVEELMTHMGLMGAKKKDNKKDR